MTLWVLGLLVIASCLAYYVIILADKQANNTVKQLGYLVGVIGIASIAFSILLKVYYAFEAITKV